MLKLLKFLGFPDILYTIFGANRKIFYLATMQPDNGFVYCMHKVNDTFSKVATLPFQKRYKNRDENERHRLHRLWRERHRERQYM